MRGDDFPCCTTGAHEATTNSELTVAADTERERLIARASWWSGWCTDNNLMLLGSELLDMKHQMALDRDCPTCAHQSPSKPLSPQSGTDTRSTTLSPQMGAQTKKEGKQ